MRKQLLIASLALAFTTQFALAQSGKAAPTDAAKPSETTEPLKNDEATDAKPAKKSAAKKRETREQKARRIAKKYGVTW